MAPAGCGGKPGWGNGNHRHRGGGESSARWLHAALHRRPDPQRDLAPVAALAKNDLLVVVHPSTGIRSLADLIAAAKAKPGALTFASAGKAYPSHLCGEMLKRQADIDMTHAPYSGAAPAMNAVLAGDVTMVCTPIPLGMAHFKAGKVYALRAGRH